MTLGTLSPFARLLAAALESAGWSARPGTLSWVHPCGLTLTLGVGFRALLSFSGSPETAWRLSTRKLSSESAAADVARQAADCVHAVLLLDARQIAAQGD